MIIKQEIPVGPKICVWERGGESWKWYQPESAQSGPSQPWGVEAAVPTQGPTGQTVLLTLSWLGLWFLIRVP